MSLLLDFWQFVKGAIVSVLVGDWMPFRMACALRSLQQGVNNVGNRQQNRRALLALAITNANGAATWAKWRVGSVTRVSGNSLLIRVRSAPGYVSPVGTNH